MPALAARPAVKAERTRAAILAAAERLFARRGYAATRLEDVAEAVGVKRAAIFYYFRDKRALYDAVIEDAFSELVARLDAVYSSPSPIALRVEWAVEVWVDAILARPALARLILRHAADAEEQPTREPLSSGRTAAAHGMGVVRRGAPQRRARTAARRPVPRRERGNRRHGLLRLRARATVPARRLRSARAGAGGGPQARRAAHRAAPARDRRARGVRGGGR